MSQFQTIQNQLFQTQDISQKKFTDLVQNVKKAIKTTEDVQKIFEILKTNLTIVKSPQNFKYFIRFFNFLRMTICNKVLKKLFTPEIEQEFLSICLSYSGKYLTIHFDDSQKKTLKKIARVFSSFSTDILVAKYQKEEATLKVRERLLLIYLIVNIRNKPECTQDKLVEKLNQDFLVDTKQQNLKGFKFTKLIANAFNEKIYAEQFLPTCQKLIRRSEANFKTFLATLICNIDYSKVAEEILFKNLKDTYQSKDNSRIAYAMASRIATRCYSPEVQQIILDNYYQMLQKTHSEDQKFEYLMIITNLAQSTQQKNDTLLQKIISIIIEQSNCISTEVQFTRINAQLQKIMKNGSEAFSFTDFNMFTDNFSSAKKNKFQAVILCSLLSQYIKRGIKGEDQQQQIAKIGEQITSEIYLANLKDSKKLVTNSFLFVASLETSTLCVQFSENIQKEILSSLPKLLIIDIYVNTREYLETNPAYELTMYLSSLIRILYLINKDQANKTALNTTSLQILQNTITYLLLNTKISSEDFRYFLAEPSVQVFESISNGLFFYYYLVYPQEICHFESLIHRNCQVIQILLKQLQDLGEKLLDITDFSSFNFIVFNTEISKPVYEQKYWQIVAPFQENLRQKIEQQENIYTAYLLNSKMFIQNKNSVIRLGAKGIAQMLINFGQVQILEPFTIFLQKINHEEKHEPLEEFIEKSQAVEKTYFEQKLSAEKEVFFAQQILGGANILLSVEEQEEAQDSISQAKQETAASKVISKKPTKKTGKAPIKKKTNTSTAQSSQPTNLEKFIMLDEEELKIKQYKDHKAKMLLYYNWSMEFIILLGSSYYAKSPEYFFNELLSGFIQVCGDSALQPSFKTLATQIFQKQRDGFAQNKEALAEFLVKFCEGQVPNDKNLDGFTKFQNYILNIKDFSNTLPEYIINFLHITQKYIISQNGFDIDMKRLSMDFYLQLDENKYKSYILEIFESLNDNLNILASQPNTLNFLNKLMRIQEDFQKISLLFRDILNNMDKAKLIVLQALIANKQLSFVPTFDDIIKLRILMIDDNEAIQSLAETTLNQFPYELNAKKIESFDLETFALVHSRENSEKFTKLSKEILKKHPDYNKVFFKILIKSAQNLYDNPEISEECLLYFPYFLVENIEFISGEILDTIFPVLVEKYTNQDKESVQSQSLAAGIEIIKFHGAKHSSHIISILEKFLKSKDDQHQLSTIIFLGVIAPYIKNKAQVEGVSQKIMSLFEKGSENMQKQLARNMPELLNFFENPKKTALSALQDLTYHSNLEMKRGCSYLIAGLNKGLGVLAIEELKIFEFIDSNTDLKKEKSIKISVLLLVQSYLETFGRVIEPYIIRLTEIVMLFFTDRLEEIRDIALTTIKLMMKTLTAYGVKIILPQMLTGLEEPQWQAKVNNIWSLGNMAYCSAKQLSQCLPQIVPKISQCLSDTHPAIREASNDSLQNIGSTIQNPEISDIVDILIQALSDPFEKNKQGLEVLLQTKFEHYIDAPSLALVIPILDYAQKQKRNPDARMDACQVIGSISSLIKDISDLIPYMDILVEGLHSALGDPDVGVRTFGAKAVGKLAQKLDGLNAEKYFTFVQKSLESEHTPSIERGGVASALAEMMCSLGPEYFEMKLNEIFQKMKDPREYFIEGYIGVFVFLPVILKDKFKVYISKVLDNTVEYVTHYNEKVRDISLRVLKILIQNFGIDNTDLLMKPINDGMFSTNWRKRNSALILSGEMLEVLSKFTKISEGEEYTPQQLEKITARNTNVMGIYILRSDEIDQIKNTATNVWKNFIENTPKTLKQALNIFFDKLCASIMMPLDIQVITIKSLKEFSSKYGESFFPQIMDEVDNKLKTKGEDLGYITGLCLVLREILLEISPIVLNRYRDQFITMVKKYLFTQDKYLREAIFKFYRIIVEQCTGNDYILQQIINTNFNEFCALDSETDPKYNTYIEIFNNILQQNSQKIQAHVIPILFQAPFKVQQVDIITNNAPIVGKYVYELINKNRGGFEIMLEESFKCEDKNLLASMLYCLEQLSINIGKEDMKKLFNYIVFTLNNLNNKIDDNLKELDIVLSILNFYFYNTSDRLEEYNNDFIQQLVPNIFLDSKYTPIIKRTNDIFQSFFGSIDKKIHFRMMQTTSLLIRNNIDTILTMKNLKPNEYKINGFNVGDEPGQGISPYIDMIISCLVYNSDAEFDHALNLVDYIVTHSELENLNVHIMKIVGPLVRVINYKYEQDRKERIVQILHRITERKMDIHVFNTQLQSTYLKLLQEFPRDLEFLKKISQNMLDLIEFSNKKDLILHELNHRFKEETNQIVKEAYLYVIVKYIKTDAQNNKQYFAKALLEKLFENFQKISHKDDFNNNILFYLSKLIGHLSNYTTPKKIQQYQQEILMTLSEHNDTPHQLFFCLSNLLSIYNYNTQLHSSEPSEEWQAFKPLENIQELMEKNISHFNEKEWLHYISSTINKINKNKNSITGQLISKSVKMPDLLQYVDPQLLEFNDVKELFK